MSEIDLLRKVIIFVFFIELLGFLFTAFVGTTSFPTLNQTELGQTISKQTLIMQKDANTTFIQSNFTNSVFGLNWFLNGILYVANGFVKLIFLSLDLIILFIDYILFIFYILMIYLPALLGSLNLGVFSLVFSTGYYLLAILLVVYLVYLITHIWKRVKPV